jgi:hypothetical protein
MILIFAMLLVLLAPALAQQQTLYGPDGRVVGRSVTDSQGTTLTLRCRRPQDRQHHHQPRWHRHRLRR